MPLPAKPYTPPVMPGPAPPLPAGPAPQPGYQQQQDAAAAHAAAWAAYYQAQGQAYPAATAQAGAGAAAPAGQNPYANYGYGGAAQQQHLAQGQGFAQPHAGPSQYRPPPAQAYPAGYQAVAPGYGGQQPAYNAQAGYQGTPPQQGGYQTPQPGYPPQPFGPQQPAQAPYRPPAGPQQPFNGPQQPYQQYNGPPRPPQQYPPQNFRPSPSPGPPPNRPFQQNPQGMMGRVPSGPSSRPPVHTPPSIPPAKRPRFDGPKGPAGVGMQPNRSPVRPVGINNGQPGFNPNPPTTNPVPASSGIPPRPPVAPANAPSRSSAPPPTSRPPIHLGLNGPPPVLPFAPQAPMSGIPGVRMGGVVPVAPPLRGGRGLGRGGSTMGMANAPKGPSGMRRSDLLPRHPNAHHHREIDRKRKEKEREREKEKEAKTTMTDFRIVGIEMKSLGWSWGDVNGQTAESESANDFKEVGSEPVPEVEVKVEDAKGEEAEAEPKVKADEAASSETVEKEEGGGVGEPGVKTEDVEVKNEPDSETVEEKRGAKRKAKSPEGDEGSSPKKRSGDYILTHGKPNEPLSASHESNQNRFRIYFESPPELDRVPKALRRNPNKRWRREESGSVAPSRQGREETVMTVGTVAEEGDGVAPTEAEATVEAEIGVEVEGEEPKAVEGEVEKAVEGPFESAVEQSSQQGEAAISQQDAETSAPAGDTGALHTGVEDESAVENATLAADHTGDVETAAAIDLPSQPVETAEETAPTTADTEEDADVSMRTDGGAMAEAIDEVDQITDPAAPTIDTGTSAPVLEGVQADTIPPAADSAVEDTAGSAIQAATTVESAEESKPPTPLPTQTRTRRRSSVSTTGPERSRNDVEDGERAQLEEYERAHGAIGSPSTNRLSILYQDSSRRLCFDASIVDKVRIHRSEGKIEVVLARLEPKIVNGDKAESSGKAEREVEGEEKDKVELEKSDEAEAEARTPLPKGILVEMYDKVDQRFASATKEQLAQMYAEANTETNHLPPLHQATSEPITVTVYLNKKRPLSEPKWCRTNSADEWLIEQFGSKRAATEAGWSGKLEIADPDPAPTLENIMDSWASSTSSTTGPSSDRKAFTASLLSDPYDLLEILLRLTRGERNPTPGATGGSASSLGLLATAIRPDSPYASHQTHVSLAILAMYRLTTDYAQKAGEQSNVMNEKISDIIKSLPVGMIHKSLDGLYREWATGDRKK